MKLKIATVVIASLVLVTSISTEVVAKETIPVSMSSSKVNLDACFEPTLEEKQQQAKARKENDEQETEALKYIAAESEKAHNQRVADAKERIAAAQAEAETQAAAAAQVTYVSNLSLSEYEAKEWIAAHESGGDYNAVSPSGKYIGRYQLTASYLNGDYSIENQEATADAYVYSVYGSWYNAYLHWLDYSWY